MYAQLLSLFLRHTISLTKFAVVFHNLCQKVRRFPRIQIYTPILLLQRQTSLRIPQEPRLGHMVLRPWPPPKTGLRYHLSR